MNKKTAIIIGVVILLLTSIITPFIIRKISKKAENNQTEKEINSVSDKQEEIGILDRITQNDSESSSGDSNTEETQVESGDGIEKIEENEVSSTDKTSRNKSSLNSPKSTTTQTTTNQIQLAEERASNEIEIVETVEEVIENAVVIDVSNTTDTVQIVEDNQALAVDNVIVEQPSVTLPEGAVGVLKIEKLGLNQKVADGHSLDVLKTNLGHVDETAYTTGNIGILGHNSGNAGYFKNLWDLKIGDVIEYTTVYGTKTYKVSDVVQIADDDWSMLSNTTDNRITLITCVKNVPEKRWCIQATEI